MSTRLLLRLCLFCLPVLGLAVTPSRADIVVPPPAAAVAPAPAPAAAAKPDSEGYVPENRPANMTSVEEGIPAAPLVASAYGFIWVAVLVFVGLTARRTRQLENEIAELAARLGQKTGSPS